MVFVDTKYRILSHKKTVNQDCKSCPTSLSFVYLFSCHVYRCYNTTLRAIIPLPDLNAPVGSAAHLNAYQEFPAGSTVMALYPDTSCFYRAEVISTPKDMQPPGRVCILYLLDLPFVAHRGSVRSCPGCSIFEIRAYVQTEIRRRR